MTANGSLRAPRRRAPRARPTLVSRASVARPGTQGDTSGSRFAILALGPGSRSARASALTALARDTSSLRNLARQRHPPDRRRGAAGPAEADETAVGVVEIV